MEHMIAKQKKTAAPQQGQAPAPQTPLDAAYEKYMQTQKGTPEHDKAGKELVDVLFTNAT